MKTVGLVMACAVFGLCLGVGVTWARHGFVHSFEDPALVAAPSQPVDAGPPGKVMVDAEEFNFGTIERDEYVKHEFTFTNSGQGMLELVKGGTTCMKCTIADIGQARLAPGESTTVTVNYHADIPDREFRQSATILIKGDPERERVSLTVFGNITNSFQLTSNLFALSKFSVNETKQAEIKLYTKSGDDLEALEHHWSNKETADHFEVEFKKIPKDQIEEPNAESGMSILLSVKPGLPLGPVRQSLHLETNMKRNAIFDLPIQGTVDSDISIIGKGWNTKKEDGVDDSVLEIGAVRRGLGAKRGLTLTIRGPHRNDIELSVASVSEPVLKVKLGERITNELVVVVPIEIEIPPGSPAVNHLGGVQSKLAKIMIETTHPTAKQVPIYVQFAVVED